MLTSNLGVSSIQSCREKWNNLSSSPKWTKTKQVEEELNQETCVCIDYLNLVVSFAIVRRSGRSRKNVGFPSDPKPGRHELCQILLQHFFPCFFRRPQVLDALVPGGRRRGELHRKILVKNIRIPEEYISPRPSDLDPVLGVLERIAIESVDVFEQPRRWRVSQCGIGENTSGQDQRHCTPPGNCKSFNLITY